MATYAYVDVKFKIERIAQELFQPIRFGNEIAELMQIDPATVSVTPLTFRRRRLLATSIIVNVHFENVIDPVTFMQKLRSLIDNPDQQQNLLYNMRALDYEAWGNAFIYILDDKRTTPDETGSIAFIVIASSISLALILMGPVRRALNYLTQRYYHRVNFITTESDRLNKSSFDNPLYDHEREFDSNQELRLVVPTTSTSGGTGTNDAMTYLNHYDNDLDDMDDDVTFNITSTSTSSSSTAFITPSSSTFSKSNKFSTS